MLDNFGINKRDEWSKGDGIGKNYFNNWLEHCKDIE